MSGIVLAFVGGSYGGAAVVVVVSGTFSGGPIMSTPFGG
jgi:hypothetical protein